MKALRDEIRELRELIEELNITEINSTLELKQDKLKDVVEFSLIKNEDGNITYKSINEELEKLNELLEKVKDLKNEIDRKQEKLDNDKLEKLDANFDDFITTTKFGELKSELVQVLEKVKELKNEVSSKQAKIDESKLNKLDFNFDEFATTNKLEGLKNELLEKVNLLDAKIPEDEKLNQLYVRKEGFPDKDDVVVRDDLKKYSTTKEFKKELEKKLNKDEAENIYLKKADEKDISNLVNRDELNSYILKSELPTLNEFVLKNELKVYATKAEIPIIKHLISKSEVENNFAKKSDIPKVDLFITRGEVVRGYVSLFDFNNLKNAVGLGQQPVDIKNLLSKNDAGRIYATKNELTSYVLTDTLTNTLTTSLNNYLTKQEASRVYKNISEYDSEKQALNDRLDALHTKETFEQFKVENKALNDENLRQINELKVNKQDKLSQPQLNNLNLDHNLYLKQANLDSFKSEAERVYVKKADAPNLDLYLKSNDASNLYLKSSVAENLYLKTNDAQNLYLKSSVAEGLYLKTNELTNYVRNSVLSQKEQAINNKLAEIQVLKQKDVELNSKVEEVKRNYVLKTDLSTNYTTTENLNRKIDDVKRELKSEHNSFALSSSLTNYALSSSLTNYKNKNEANNEHSQINNKIDEVKRDYLTKTNAEQTYLKITDTPNISPLTQKIDELEQRPQLTDERLKEQIERVVNENEQRFRGLQGLAGADGADGRTPTTEELNSLITPKIDERFSQLTLKRWNLPVAVEDITFSNYERGNSINDTYACLLQVDGYETEEKLKHLIGYLKYGASYDEKEAFTNKLKEYVRTQNTSNSPLWKIYLWKATAQKESSSLENPHPPIVGGLRPDIDNRFWIPSNSFMGNNWKFKNDDSIKLGMKFLIERYTWPYQDNIFLRQDFGQIYTKDEVDRKLEELRRELRRP